MTNESEFTLADRAAIEANLAFDNAWAHFRRAWRTSQAAKTEAAHREMRRAAQVLDEARVRRDAASERLNNIRVELPSGEARP